MTGSGLVSLRTTSPESPETIRIGFVSPDLGNHPVGIFLAPLLERLKEVPDVETFCYSDSGRTDEFTNRNRASADHWHDIKGIDHEAVARQIRGDRIQILFDLTGHTDDNRLPTVREETGAGADHLGGLCRHDRPGNDGLHPDRSVSHARIL